MQEDVVRFTVLLEDLTRDVRVIAEAQASGNEHLDRMEKSLEGLDKKVDRVEMRLDLLEMNVKGLETNVKGLETNVKGLETKFDGFAAETRGRLERIESHLELNGSTPRARSTKRLASKPRKKS